MNPLVHPENRSRGQMVPTNVAAVEVFRMPVAIVIGQPVQPCPHPLRRRFDVHGVMEPNHLAISLVRTRKSEHVIPAVPVRIHRVVVAASEAFALLELPPHSRFIKPDPGRYPDERPGSTECAKTGERDALRNATTRRRDVSERDLPRSAERHDEMAVPVRHASTCDAYVQPNPERSLATSAYGGSGIAR